MNTWKCTDPSAKGNKFSLKKSDLIWVSAANITALIAAVIIGLVMPAFTDYETYAGYRAYTLFTAYTGLLQLGFVNGIALRYGDLDRDRLPKETFRQYTRCFTGMQLIAVLVLAVIHFAVKGHEVTPLLFVIITILPDNLRVYYATILNNTGRFRTDSLNQIFYRILQLAGFLVILYTKKNGWIYYLAYTVFLNILFWLVFALQNLDVTFGPVAKKQDLILEIRENIKRGAPVIFGEQLGILMLGADSIFALFLFDSKQFSLYSFAVYVVVTAFTILNAANAVIFPYLKRLDEKEVGERYSFLKKVSLGLFVFSIPGFVLCHILIVRLMPAYTQALPYLDILGFTLLFRLLGSMACANTMKALDMEKEYFMCNLAACILAFVADFAAYLIWHDLRAIAAASVIVFAFWFVVCDEKLKKRIAVLSRSDD